MTDPNAVDIARLEGKIDALSAIVTERLQSLDNKIDSGHSASAQSMASMTATVATLATKVETTYVRKDVYNLAHLDLETRVQKVEERHTWLTRVAFSGLVLPVVVAIVTAILLTGGGR